MTAAREPQKKSTKPERLVASVSKQTLVALDTMHEQGRPLTVTSRQYDMSFGSLKAIIASEVIRHTRGMTKERRDKLARTVARAILRKKLIELRELDLIDAKRRRPNEPLFAMYVSKSGVALLERGSRSKHPSAGGTRRRSQQPEEDAA